MKTNFKKTTAEAAIFLLFICVFQSCTWNVKSENVDTLRVAPTGETGGVIFPTKFDSDHVVVGKNGCSLIFRPVQGYVKYDLRVQFGDQLTATQVEPGLYEFKEIYCGNHSYDIMFTNFPKFNVFKDKISMLIGFDAFFNQNASGSTNGLSSRSKSLEEIKKAIQQLPDDSKSKLVSAYTGQELQSRVEQTNLFVSAAFFDKKGNEIKFDNNVVRNALLGCYTQEVTYNPLLIGRLKLKMNTNPPRQIQTLENTSTSSTSYRQCISEELLKLVILDLAIDHLEVQL